jgi:transposase
MPRNNKKYTPEFKIQVIETKMKENLSSYETARRFNLYTSINGYEYPAHKYILSWERIYLEEGKEGFYIEKRGRGLKGKGRKKNLEPKVEEDLIAKCQRLEMENEYLKKLSALVSAREQKEKK